MSMLKHQDKEVNDRVNWQLQFIFIISKELMFSIESKELLERLSKIIVLYPAASNETQAWDPRQKKEYDST